MKMVLRERINDFRWNARVLQCCSFGSGISNLIVNKAILNMDSGSHRWVSASEVAV